MADSKPNLVIHGYVEKDKVFPNYSRVITVTGEKLLIETKGIVKSFPIEASGESGLNRVLIEQNTNIWMGISSELLQSFNDGNSDIGLKSIMKWVDDGGTISKSRDDTFSAGNLP